MKNCPKCGVELADDAVFCTECGEKLEAAPEVEVAPEVEAAPEVEVAPEVEAAPAAPAAPAKKNNIPKILGFVGIGAMALYLVCYLLGLIPYIGFLFSLAGGFFTFVAFVVSIVGIILAVKDVKNGGSKSALTINIIVLVASILLPVILFIASFIFGVIFGLLFGVTGGLMEDGFLFEILEELFYELGIY